jgi:hypothetical protein
MKSLLTAPLLWLSPFIDYIGPQDVQLTPLCSADPPGWPSLDAQDLLALITRDKFGLALVATQKVVQIVHNLLWYAACECISGATPALPAQPSAPAGTPAFNPPSVVRTPTNMPCNSFTDSLQNFTANAGLSRTQLGWEGLTATSARAIIKTAQVVAPGPTLTITIEQQQQRFGPLVVVSTRNYTMPPGVTLDLTFPIITPADTFLYKVQADATSGTTSEQGTLEIYCQGEQPGPIGPPCPPDPTMLGLLYQILDMATLIQRQAVPFAYVASTVHSGLTGSGELAVADLLGVLVELTTVPATLGRVAGDPTRLFDAGWLALGTADGWGWRQPVETALKLALPAPSGLYTRIGYSLQVGVVARITELVREP